MLTAKLLVGPLLLLLLLVGPARATEHIDEEHDEPDCTGANEEVTTCAGCDITCENPDPECPEDCEAGCACAVGFVREGSICVEESSTCFTCGVRPCGCVAGMNCPDGKRTCETCGNCDYGQSCCCDLFAPCPIDHSCEARDYPCPTLHHNRCDKSKCTPDAKHCCCVPRTSCKGPKLCQCSKKPCVDSGLASCLASECRGDCPDKYKYCCCGPKPDGNCQCSRCDDCSCEDKPCAQLEKLDCKDRRCYPRCAWGKHCCCQPEFPKCTGIIVGMLRSCWLNRLPYARCEDGPPHLQHWPKDKCCCTRTTPGYERIFDTTVRCMRMGNCQRNGYAYGNPDFCGHTCEPQRCCSRKRRKD